MWVQVVDGSYVRFDGYTALKVYTVTGGYRIGNGVSASGFFTLYDTQEDAQAALDALVQQFGVVNPSA